MNEVNILLVLIFVLICACAFFSHQAVKVIKQKKDVTLRWIACYVSWSPTGFDAMPGYITDWEKRWKKAGGKMEDFYEIASKRLVKEFEKVENYDQFSDVDRRFGILSKDRIPTDERFFDIFNQKFIFHKERIKKIIDSIPEPEGDSFVKLKKKEALNSFLFHVSWR